MRAGAVILSGLIAGLWTACAEEKLPELKVGLNTYSNVTVTTVTPTDIYFTHAGGMGNAKLKQLAPDLQKRFGYDARQAGEVEQKRATANAQFHSQILRQPAPPPPPPAAAKNAPAQPTAETYGDVPAKYRDTTLTRTGEMAPVSSLRTIDDQTVDFRGKVVVLNFFATWCGPCMAEMPHVEKNLWRQFKDKGLIVVAVGRGHSASDLAEFKRQNGYSFRLAADPQEECYRKFAAEYIPRSVLIGKDGRIKLQTIGFSADDFNSLIKATAAELRK
jgi:peroxiredoxin